MDIQDVNNERIIFGPSRAGEHEEGSDEAAKCQFFKDDHACRVEQVWRGETRRVGPDRAVESRALQHAT
jgi:hypothetical protein